MKLRRIEPKSLLSILIKRTVILLFLMNLLFILLYGIGNYQNFLAETQLLLLNLLLNGSILLSLFGFGAFLYFTFKKTKTTNSIVGYSFIAFFACLLSLAAAFLIQVTKGTS